MGRNTPHTAKMLRVKGRLRYAVKQGWVERPVMCEICNQVKIIIGHHEDYDKPLDVIWMCHKCHMNYHHGIKAAADEIRIKVKELYIERYGKTTSQQSSRIRYGRGWKYYKNSD